jgi:predicted RNase H-like nuclease (RuvC/YqgF family)
VARSTQAKKDKKSEKVYMKQMSDLTQIVQKQHIENKKLEKLLSDSKRKSLQLSLALSLKEEKTSSDPWDKFVVSKYQAHNMQ